MPSTAALNRAVGVAPTLISSTGTPSVLTCSASDVEHRPLALRYGLHFIR